MADKPQKPVVNKKKLEIARLEDHGFEYDERPFRNVICTVVYLMIILLLVVGGVFSFLKKNPDYKDIITGEYLADIRNCPESKLQSMPVLELSDEDLQYWKDYNASGQLSADVQKFAEDYIDFNALQKISGKWMAITAFGAIIVGVAFLWLFSTCPWIMVILTLIFMFIIPAGGAAFLMIVKGYSMMSVGIPLIVAAVVVLIILCLLMTAFPLVVKLLDKASDCVMEQPGVPGMVLVLIVALVIILIPMVTAVFFAGQVGTVIPNPASYVTKSPFNNGCVRLETVPVACCVYEMDEWARAYYYFAIGTIVWTVFLVMQVKTYFVAGAATQWYFNNEDPPEWSPTLLSMKHALTSSFGSLALSSLILTLLAGIRALVEKLRRMGKGNFLVNCIACCVQCIISILNTITKFATMQMAITGQGFWSAAESVCKLLSRNTLDAFGVWWLPDFILYAAAIFASITWGAISYYIYYQIHSSAPNVDKEALYLGISGALLCLVVLTFFVFVLLNIVDALYIAMAIEKDKGGDAKRSDVHDIFHELPNVKRKQAEKEAENGTPQEGLL